MRQQYLRLNLKKFHLMYVYAYEFCTTYNILVPSFKYLPKSITFLN